MHNVEKTNENQLPLTTLTLNLTILTMSLKSLKLKVFKSEGL